MWIALQYGNIVVEQKIQTNEKYLKFFKIELFAHCHVYTLYILLFQPKWKKSQPNPTEIENFNSQEKKRNV